MSNITIDRTQIREALWGSSFQEVRVSPKAIAFIDTYDNINHIFEPQNAVIVEVVNGGSPCWQYVNGIQPKDIQHAEPFGWFEVETTLEDSVELPFLGGKIVTIRVVDADLMGGILPIEIKLYARDKDAEVSLTRAFRDDEDMLLTMCQPVRYMQVSMPVKIGSEALSISDLVEKNNAFAESLEEEDDQPEIGQGMSLGDLLTKHLTDKSQEGIQQDPNALWLEPDWRID
ncbi:MAG: hypothetical protein VX730_07165 [Pseudomonadota bacterium]|nr:hypothetical protein [Pseudomonadota bacterium]